MFKVRRKGEKRVYKVYDVRINENGDTLFLIYDEALIINFRVHYAWVWENACSFVPLDY